MVLSYDKATKNGNTRYTTTTQWLLYINTLTPYAETQKDVQVWLKYDATERAEKLPLCVLRWSAEHHCYFIRMDRGRTVYNVSITPLEHARIYDIVYGAHLAFCAWWGDVKPSLLGEMGNWEVDVLPEYR